MSILVTGGAGFIGSHFIERLLARGNEQIVCLDDFNADYDPALKRANVAGFLSDRRVQIVEQSFCDAAAMQRLLVERKVRRIMHLGGRAGVRASVERPLEYETANVRGTLTLLEAARNAAMDRFVLVSSS